MRRGALLGFVLAASAAATAARAGDVTDTDRQIAQSLFDEARALLESGHVAEACPKFAESQRLDPGGGTLLNLALCLETAGQTASAWARYQEAVALAVRDGRKDREEFGRAHLAEITPKLARLLVVVPPEAAAADPVVQLDGSRLAREAWGTAIPVDPGTHHVTASATGNAAMSWDTTVDVREPGRTVRVEVGVPHGSPIEILPARPPSAPVEARRSTAFWIALGTGGVALAASAIVGGMALAANSDAQTGCVPERAYCPPAARDASTRARTLAWISTGLTAGGLVVGGAAFLLPLETKATVETSSAGVRFTILRSF